MVSCFLMSSGFGFSSALATWPKQRDVTAATTVTPSAILFIVKLPLPSSTLARGAEPHALTLVKSNEAVGGA